MFSSTEKVVGTYMYMYVTIVHCLVHILHVHVIKSIWEEIGVRNKLLIYYLSCFTKIGAVCGILFYS